MPTSDDVLRDEKHKRVILSFLSPRRPLLPSLFGAGNKLASLAEDLQDPNVSIIYIDKDNHFDKNGNLKPLDELPPEFQDLVNAEKIDIHGHGSAGSDIIASDFWAYPIFKSTYLGWLRSPFPKKFNTDNIAPILKHCKNAPEVEVVVCESAKGKKDAKGVLQDSFCDRLGKKLLDISDSSDEENITKEVNSLPSKIIGYKDTIALAGLGEKRCAVYVPITYVEKFTANLQTLSCIIPIIGPIVAAVISVALLGAEKLFRAIFSPFKMCASNEQIEADRKSASKETVVEQSVYRKPQHKESIVSSSYLNIASSLPCKEGLTPKTDLVDMKKESPIVQDEVVNISVNMEDDPNDDKQSVSTHSFH